MPDVRILKWYSEMGGQCLTLGSDAHRLPEISLHLEKGLEAVRAAGIKAITQFEQRQAFLLPLE